MFKDRKHPAREKNAGWEAKTVSLFHVFLPALYLLAADQIVPTQIKGGSAFPSPLTQMLISFGNIITDTPRINTLYSSIQSNWHSVLIITKNKHIYNCLFAILNLLLICNILVCLIIFLNLKSMLSGISITILLNFYYCLHRISIFNLSTYLFLGL